MLDRRIHLDDAFVSASLAKLKCCNVINVTFNQKCSFVEWIDLNNYCVFVNLQ